MVDLVQIKHPKTGRYTKINRDTGTIVSHKRTKGPYKNVPIFEKEEKKEEVKPDHVVKIAFDQKYKCHHPTSGYCRECYKKSREI